MRENNKTCIICGEKYTYCLSCSQFAREPKWKTIFHEENCLNIFNIISDFKAEIITKEKAVTLLSSCDLSKKDTYPDVVKNQIKEIFEISVSDIASVNKTISEAKEVMTSVENTEEKVQKTFKKK